MCTTHTMFTEAVSVPILSGVVSPSYPLYISSTTAFYFILFFPTTATDAILKNEGLAEDCGNEHDVMSERCGKLVTMTTLRTRIDFRAL